MAVMRNDEVLYLTSAAIVENVGEQDNSDIVIHILSLIASIEITLSWLQL